MRKLLGSAEFMQNDHRWCLWNENGELNRAMEIPEIRKRVLRTKKMREKEERKRNRTSFQRLSMNRMIWSVKMS